ncbi:MAG: hypothetical protein IIB37_01475 [Gemmatimonadetes bacterium]|nr:hypothetical protein [Gemmatimonadota bacterium]MCH8811587.1 hypothetical protein [Gemmatimonadota bacterium]
MDWVATRKPPAPDELKAWLKIPDGGSDPDGGPDGGVASVPECLLRAGLLHLEEAVARPGRDREAAYQLLAADALYTYGCEAASEAPDVRAVLRDALGRVSAGGSAGGTFA